MISIVYWSQTGNTQAMAEAISEGVTEAGKEAKIIDVTDASLDALKTEKVFALGCPAMGAEVLEESEMEPLYPSWKEALVERPLHSLAHMAGVTVSGYVTG